MVRPIDQITGCKKATYEIVRELARAIAGVTPITAAPTCKAQNNAGLRETVSFTQRLCDVVSPHTESVHRENENPLK